MDATLGSIGLYWYPDYFLVSETPKTLKLMINCLICVMKRDFLSWKTSASEAKLDCVCTR